MVRISQLVLPLLAVGTASAFAPPAVAPTRTFVRPSTTIRLAADVPKAEEVKEAPPAEEVKAEPAPPKAKDEPAPAGKLVAIKEDTVEFTAGILGGAAGFALGGPVLGAIGAALGNFASKTDSEVGNVAQAVSTTSIEAYNYLAKLDAKYEVLNKAKSSLEAALDRVKSSDSVDPETVKKVESALANTTSKIKEINDEYDLVGAGFTALGVVGDLVEKAIKKAGELNEEYKLTDKATEAIKKAVDQAKEASKEASKA